LQTKKEFDVSLMSQNREYCEELNNQSRINSDLIYLLDEQKRYNSLNRKMVSDIEEENKSLKSLLSEITLVKF
jgi:hypothetical protein